MIATTATTTTAAAVMVTMVNAMAKIVVDFQEPFFPKQSTSCNSIKYFNYMPFHSIHPLANCAREFMMVIILMENMLSKILLT